MQQLSPRYHPANVFRMCKCVMDVFFSEAESVWWSIKFNESQCKRYGVTLHFFTGQNLLKKYSEKININTINWENLFHRSAEHEQWNAQSLINFNRRIEVRVIHYYTPKIFRKSNISYPLICMCVYQGIRNVGFLKGS